MTQTPRPSLKNLSRATTVAVSCLFAVVVLYIFGPPPIAAAFNGAASATATAPAPCEPAPHGVVKVMPLGDSITKGFGYPSYGGYRVSLWQQLVQNDKDNIDFIGSVDRGPSVLGDRDNEGHDGWTIGGTGQTTLTGSIDAWLAVYKPDVILLHAGTNDISKGIAGPVVADRLDTLLGKIYADLPNVKVVVAQIIRSHTTSTARDAVELAYHDAIPPMVAKYASQGRNIQLVDMSKTLSFATDYSDTFHPNVSGYDKMANAWYPLVSALYKTF